ncbi:MAG: PEGA domain-containing protein [Fibrobacter sp.]|nr:PEGA domain-containing protein [Fibrobacter sp.]
MKTGTVFPLIMRFILIFGIFKIAFADGSLTVHTVPEGIEVWLDNMFIGNSPINNKKLKPGQYTLKLVDPVQRSSTEEDVFIQDNETTVIEKTIKSNFGTLKITSDPEGAEVYVSTELGKTPLSNEFMNPGKYRLEIRHPNTKYHPISEDLVIPKGEMVSIAKELEKEKTFGKKDMFRLILGAGTAVGFIFGAIEYGLYKQYNEQAGFPVADSDKLRKDADKSKFLSILGIIGGSLCLTGLEIVAFF